MEKKLIPVSKIMSDKSVKYGYKDEYDNLIIPYMYEYAYTFSCGLAGVRDSNTHLVGFIDEKNNLIIDYEFDYIQPFNSGLSWVCKDGLWCEIDKRGNTIIPPKYLKTRTCIDGIIIVCNYASKWGIIDMYDNVIIPFCYDNIKILDENTYKGYINGIWTDINLNEKNKIYTKMQTL